MWQAAGVTVWRLPGRIRFSREPLIRLNCDGGDTIPRKAI
jgi:hypothetical protein